MKKTDLYRLKFRAINVGTSEIVLESIKAVDSKINTQVYTIGKKVFITQTDRHQEEPGTGDTGTPEPVKEVPGTSDSKPDGDDTTEGDETEDEVVTKIKELAEGIEAKDDEEKTLIINFFNEYQKDILSILDTEKDPELALKQVVALIETASKIYLNSMNLEAAQNPKSSIAEALEKVMEVIERLENLSTINELVKLLIVSVADVTGTSHVTYIEKKILKESLLILCKDLC